MDDKDHQSDFGDHNNDDDDDYNDDDDDNNDEDDNNNEEDNNNEDDNNNDDCVEYVFTGKNANDYKHEVNDSDGYLPTYMYTII